MAGFQTHVTTSTVLGVGYGTAGFFLAGAPISTSLLAGGLCGVSGMLPDIDSDNGIPLRESMAFAAAFVPMLLIDRMEALGLDREGMVLVGSLLYLGIRFGVSKIIKRTTVHRGMWHSVPACAIAGLAAYLLCSGNDTGLRLFKAGGVMLGFLSHLVLDEIYSIDLKRGVPRLKKSFGTALKFWGKSPWANFSIYAKLLVVGALAFVDPSVMQQFRRPQQQTAESPAAGEAADNEPQAAEAARPPAEENAGADTPREASNWLDELIEWNESMWR